MAEARPLRFMPRTVQRGGAAAYAATMNLLEEPMRFAQRHLGPGLAWLFVGPNLIVFGLFTFLPIAAQYLVRVHRRHQSAAVTAPLGGPRQLQALLSCQNHFDPSTCQRDLFWHGVYNTLEFVVLQVSLMIVFS